MEITQEQTVQIETLSKTFAETILKFVYNPNDVYIGSNLPPEKIEQTFDKIFDNQQFTNFLKQNHQKYNLINVMGNNELFITYICNKLKDDINKSLTEQEEADLIGAVKEYFSSEDLMTKLFTQDELNEQVGNNSDISDVFDEQTLKQYVEDKVKDNDISEYFTDDQIIEYLENSDINISGLIKEDDVKSWIGDNSDTGIDDLFDDSDIAEFISEYDISNLGDETKSIMFDKLLEDNDLIRSMSKDQKINILKTIIESL
jgi:hypothetical protein